VAVQTHWYVRPSGCMEGDYWLPGELRINCPKSDKITNRILFMSTYDMDWRDRDKLDCNPELQFKYYYSVAFKDVESEFSEKENYSRFNNDYINNNLDYFELTIKKNNKNIND